MFERPVEATEMSVARTLADTQEYLLPAPPFMVSMRLSVLSAAVALTPDKNVSSFAVPVNESLVVVNVNVLPGLTAAVIPLPARDSFCPKEMKWSSADLNVPAVTAAATSALAAKYPAASNDANADVGARFSVSPNSWKCAKTFGNTPVATAFKTSALLIA